jgi:signal transduction histidine kinase
VTRGAKRLYSIPLERHGRWIAIQESESLEPVRREVRELTRELLTLLPFGLLAAAAGGMFLTSRALRPVEDLRRAAESIEATDLSQRLAVSGKDEFARLTTTFNAMLGRLEEAFERQRRFVGDASHELKTPLTIVQGAAELGRTDPDASEKSKKLFGRVEGAAERMSRLVQNLLLLARSDSGALEPRIEPLNARALLDAVATEASLLRPDAATILVEATESETISGDRDLLFQLLLNLADNALRHTPAEGGTVTLAALPGGFSVTDTGVGIAPEHLPHLTERFYRVDSSRARKDGGTGLGLAICDSLARAHGGSLEIQSREGQGTTVRVMLPG